MSVDIVPEQPSLSQLVAGYIATSATSSVTVRATPYTPQGTNAQRSFSSTSASDAAAGTGARQIKITYMSTAMDVLKTDTITLNGTTAVNSNATDIALIEKIEVVSVGSGGGNVGTIQIFTATAGGGSVWGSIAPSDNKTFWCHHYVASGRSFYLLNIRGDATATSGQISLFHIDNPIAALPGPQTQIASTYLHGNQTTAGLPSLDHTLSAPNVVLGPSIVFLNEKPTAVTASTTFASMEFEEF